MIKALEKDRNRRYETANGFAADVERHLNNEPVRACPPSLAYRMRKLIHRHRGPVLKQKIGNWLQQRDEVLAYCSARTCDGGTGAVYVLLKRR